MLYYGLNYSEIDYSIRISHLGKLASLFGQWNLITVYPRCPALGPY